MKTIHVVQQKRLRRFLEIHVILIIAYLTSCNSPEIEKKHSAEDKYISAFRKQEEQLFMAVHFLKEDYLDTFTFSPDKDTSIGELMARLDPYSCYLSKESNEREIATLENGTTMRFGFVEHIKNDTPFVRSLNPFSVCRKNGLCIGDQLLSLNSISLIHRSSTFIRDLFHSSNEDHYSVSILRPGEQIPRSLAVRKCDLPGDARSCSFMLDSSTGYFWFNEFNRGIADNMESTLSLLRFNNPQFSNLIIDLRWNSGGYVDEAIAMLSLFYRTFDPIIVARSEDHPYHKTTYHATRTAIFSDLHLIVLINENSYSAAELFAGTLQDWDRALVIGQQSGGKGLVMSNYKLLDGSDIFYAYQRYFLPSGRCIQIPYENGVQNEKLPESELTIYNLLHRHEKSFSCNDRVFYTVNGRSVYSQMGIIPDVFIPDYSNYYVETDLNILDGSDLVAEIAVRYQKLLIDNSTFESFVKFFPIKEATKYIDRRLKQMNCPHFQPSKIRALVRRILFCIQADYYGQGSETASTLMSDTSVNEARRIFSVEAQNLKREMAANASKESHNKKSLTHKTKKLAVN